MFAFLVNFLYQGVLIFLMKNKLLYPILMFYSCAQFSKVDVYTSNLDYVCPKIGSGMKVELKKEFKGGLDDFMKKYLLKTDNQHIEFKRTSGKDENYIKFNPIKKEIETGGLSEEKKTYKGLVFGRKNKDYDTQLNRLLEGIKSFDNTRWMYFNLDDVVECIEKGRVIKEEVLF